MIIVRRYVLASFLRLFSLALVAFCGIYLIVDLFDRVDDFIEFRAGFGEVVGYFLFKIPGIIYQVAPAAVLLASILCFVLLSRNNELTVLKASGFSLLSLSFPILLAALLLSVGLVGMQEYVVPYTNRAMAYEFSVAIKKEVPNSLFRNRLWYRSRDGSIWKVTAVDPQGRSMRDVTVFRFQGNRIAERIDAKEVFWNGKQWVFRDGVVRDFSPGGDITASRFQERAFPFTETPLDFKELRRDPNELSYRELNSYVDMLERSGLDATPYIVDRDVKLSFPFAALVMAILGIPCSLRSPRGGSVTGGIALTLLIAGCFWVLLSLGISLGHGERLPPLLAAWGANGIALSLGLWLLMTVRQ